MGGLEWERRANVSESVRREVSERDNHCCRLCGMYLEWPALHHLVFRSSGGVHEARNLITLGQPPYGCDCHLGRAHGPESATWRQVLQLAVEYPQFTGLQIRRMLG